MQSKYGADLFESTVAFPRYAAHGDRAFVAMQVTPDSHGLLFKRVIDVVGALAGLILFSPLMLIVAVAIKATSQGPVVYAQDRCGLNKRPFRMYKFRSMIADAEQLQAALEAQNEAHGPVFKILHDPRMTRLGRLLRRTSLDELPQLWNVLRGDMSLVGPRPLPYRDVDRITRPSDMRRFSMRPGLTCLWQVQGRCTIGFERWVELDLEYIDNWSLALDVRILLKTLPAVAERRRGSLITAVLDWYINRELVMTNGKGSGTRVLVTGAGGFIGHHLVTFLKKQGYWVRGVDLKYPEYEATGADEFLVLDLRRRENCLAATEADR